MYSPVRQTDNISEHHWYFACCWGVARWCTEIVCGLRDFQQDQTCVLFWLCFDLTCNLQYINSCQVWYITFRKGIDQPRKHRSLPIVCTFLLFKATPLIPSHTFETAVRMLNIPVRVEDPILRFFCSTTFLSGLKIQYSDSCSTQSCSCNRVCKIESEVHGVSSQNRLRATFCRRFAQVILHSSLAWTKCQIFLNSLQTMSVLRLETFRFRYHV